MYNISFKPPLGEAVDIISSPLSPGNQPTSILFSAHLSQGNYEKLVRDGGRVQLWSDIPRVGKVNNGAWGKMDFNEVRREVYPTELRRITLNSNAKEDAVVVVLSLLVSLPTPAAASDATKKRRFSFTYRIVYGSGGITWLGQFGKNGVVIVSRGAQPDSLYGLALSQGWSVNQAQSLCVFEVKDKVKDFSINPPPVEVAKLTKRSEFKIYALGEDSLKTDLKNARALFLVPLQPTQEQSHISIRPTYAISVSPGLSASVSDEGLVTLSGSGTAILRSGESALSGIAPFIEKVLQDGQLTNWKVVASDPESKCAVVVVGGGGGGGGAQSTGLSESDAFAISLHTLGHGGSALRLGYNQLVDTFGMTAGIDGFDILLPSSSSGEQRQPVHRFDSHSQEIGLDSQDIVLVFDGSNGHFIIRPVYDSEKGGEDAYMALESPPTEEVVVASRIPLPSDADVLPTPPVSPKLVPLDHHTSSASIDTLVGSISSLPAVQDGTATKTIFILKGPDSNAVLDEKEEPNSSPLEKVNAPSRPHPNTVSIFQTIFASIRTFLRVFFRIFLCPIIPFSQGRLRRLPAPTEAVDGVRKRDLTVEKGPPLSIEDSTQDSDLDDDDGELTVTLERQEQVRTATTVTAVA